MNSAGSGAGSNTEFQSRNRETFDSNWYRKSCAGVAYPGFNLVIEKLLIPTEKRYLPLRILKTLFQSRNRETFDSNQPVDHLVVQLLQSFNLVIEKLLIPTHDYTKIRLAFFDSFNLVIEKLLIPTLWNAIVRDVP